MRFLFVFLIVYICEQATATIYQCNSSATCGCSSSSSTVLSRIVGGEDAIQGSWSWAVSLRYYGSHFCGGSVLSSFLIITAAHCIHDIGNTAIVTIVAGSISLDTSPSNKFYQNRSIAQIYKHPNYDPLTQSNDLALLRLSSPLNITNGNGYIKPICLPTGTTVQPPDNIDMIAVGWGFTSMYSNTVSSTLQQVTVKSIPSELNECSRLIFNSQLQFCAGILTGGKDTCQGDSGGPIMTFVNGMWELHGLTSYGYGCALPTYPGVYTRVSYYVNWIKSIIQLYESTTVTPTKKTTTNIITATTRTTRKTTSKKLTLNTQKEIVSNTTNYNSTKANVFTESLFKTSHAITSRYSINQSFIYIFFLPIMIGAYFF